MDNIQEKKSLLRKEVSSIKKKYTLEELHERSLEVLSIVEISGVFQNAKNIFIYNSMEDEVQTFDFIHKWAKEKNFYLPVVIDDDIVFRSCTSSVQFKESNFGIMEPVGDNFTEYKKVDLIIIPGVAFDRKKNRMGRGRGYYDRFLKNIKAPKMGICFDFQLFDEIPAEPYDIQMDFVISENEFIW